MVDLVHPDGEIDEEGLDEASEYWDGSYDYKCNYKLMPLDYVEPTIK